MKVMIVSMNSLDPTGEAQYFRHLVAGFKALEIGIDLEVSAFALNGRGKPLKYDLQPDETEGIHYLAFKNFVEVANAHDYVIISTARFKGDYSFMAGLTTPYGVVAHSLPSIEQHKFQELWETVKPYAVYVLDGSIREKCVEFGADPKSIFFVGLPFAPEIMGPVVNDVAVPANPYVIVPARIHFVKYPGDVAKMLIEAQKSVPDLVGVFFGSEDFFYYNNLKQVMEDVDFLVLKEPYLNEEDKAIWWNWCTLAVDGTRLPKPPMRMQYTMLEAGYFMKPILVDQQRHSKLWNEKMSQLPLSAENIVRVLQDEDLREEMVIHNYAYVKSMHDAKNIALELLSPVIYDWRAE